METVLVSSAVITIFEEATPDEGLRPGEREFIRPMYIDKIINS